MLNKIEQQAANALDDLHQCANFDQTTAKIIAVLYLSKKPLSLDEIYKKVGASKTNCFLKIKRLENLEVIKKIKEKNSKKIGFYFEKNIDKMIFEHMNQRYRTLLVLTKMMFEKIISKYNINELNKEELEQLKILKIQHKKINMFIEKFEKLFSKLSKEIE